jgi:hypothetical protein
MSEREVLEFRCSLNFSKIKTSQMRAGVQGIALTSGR